MNRFAGYSLQRRLLLAVTLLLSLFLGLTGYVLDRAFRNSVETGVAQQLQTQIYVLLAAVDESEGEFYFSENLREPRFGQLNAGLYGFISSPQQGELLRTPSALEFSFPALAEGQGWGQSLAQGETRFDRYQMDSAAAYFVISYAVTWENRPEAIVFTVLESTQNYLEEVTAFRTSLFSWFAALAVLLASKLTASGLYHYLGFMFSSVLLGLAFLSIAVFSSVVAKDRTRASGIAIGLWFLFVLVFDLILLGALVGTGGKYGGEIFPYLLLLNPTDVFRILNIFSLDDVRNLYGLATVFPDALAEPWLLGSVMLLWITLPLVLAYWSFRR